MERLLSFQWKTKTKPKLNDFSLPISERNGTSAFILAKIKTKPKQREFLLLISERNGTFTFIPVKNGTKPKQKEFLYEFQREMERFVLFQLHPRKRIDSLFKKWNFDITSADTFQIGSSHLLQAVLWAWVLRILVTTSVLTAALITTLWRSVVTAGWSLGEQPASQLPELPPTGQLAAGQPTQI